MPAKVTNLAEKRPAFANLKFISIPAPDAGRKPIVVEISENYMQKYSAIGRNTKLMEAWSLLRGEKPPINLIGFHENYKDVPLIPLSEAHQVYKGLKRPHQLDNGDEIYIYVTKPLNSYEFVPTMNCLARAVAVPEKCVLTAYVQLTPNWKDNIDGGVCGKIIGWDLSLTGDEDKMTPKEADVRYQKKIW